MSWNIDRKNNNIEQLRSALDEADAAKACYQLGILEPQYLHQSLYGPAESYV